MPGSPFAVQAAWLADVAASGSHKENKVAVRTRIPSFDSPGISRGCLLGHPCGVFPEHEPASYVTGLQYHTMSLTPEAVVSSWWCHHPLVP